MKEKSAKTVVETDLEYICESLGEEFSKMSGSKLLLTGGAGFLGYYLVQSVAHWNQKHKSARISVTVFDNFMRGEPAWLRQLAQEGAVAVEKRDVNLPLDAEQEFQYIIHGASIASPIFYRQYPIETMDANVNGLRLLLDYALKRKSSRSPVEGFLFFSSSEIYGDPDKNNIPTPETYWGHVSCTGPRACYDESKRYGETLCVNFAQQHGLPVKSARPFNNYGPGLGINDKRVIPDFARDVFAGKDLTLLSDGSPTRTFCYVADAVIGYYKILAKGGKGEAYNIGVEGPEISMLELAKRITSVSKDLFGYEGKVVAGKSEDKNYLVDNPNRRCPVITKARRDLGYDPKISLEEGLRRTMMWYEGNKEF